MVSDVSRMGEWSPENDSAQWLRGDTYPRPGVTFRGENHNGTKRWSTKGTIVDVEPGRLFSFRVTAAGLKVSKWSFLIETTQGGCNLTETWIDQRGPVVKAVGRLVTGVADRTTHNRASMQRTLESLKRAAEAQSEV
jgi:hypothetical protein